MKYLHTMIRVTDLDATLAFFCDHLGLEQMGRYDIEEGRFSLIFLAPPGQPDAQIELTHNWDENEVDEGRNFGHLAYEVEDIYATFAPSSPMPVLPSTARRATVAWPFVRSPDNVSIELLQAGDALPPQEPWASMENIGHW